MLPSTFPERPRLRPFFHIVPLSGGRVQLRSAYRSLVIGGAGAPELMRLMFPLLDGTRTPDEIVEACQGHAPAAVQQALSLLQEKAVLEDAADGDRATLSPAEQEMFADQVRLFSSFVGNPYRCQAELRAKRVTLIGLTPLGLAIGRQLAHCGIGSLELIPTSASDGRAGLALLQECGHNGSRCLVRLGEPAGDGIEESLVAGCTDAHLVIVPNDGPRPALNRTANEVCLSLKVPWLPVVLFGNDVAIGPLIVPGQTPCFTCYELRMKGNLVFADEYVAFEDHLLKGVGSDVSQGGLKVYADVVAGLAAIEAIKFLTKFTYPLSFGRLIRFNFVNYQYIVHPVLRLPRCPRCGPIRPLVREWEL
jgi:molybdopterin-synthase adenylyltransferase